MRQWEVVRNWWFVLPDGTKIVIPKGFVFDGASIPRFMWAILSPTGLLLVPGLVHDFAYRYNYLWCLDRAGNLQRYNQEFGREVWDKLFCDIGRKVNGMTYIDRAAWVALRLFGWWTWQHHRDHKTAEITPALE